MEKINLFNGASYLSSLLFVIALFYISHILLIHHKTLQSISVLAVPQRVRHFQPEHYGFVIMVCMHMCICTDCNVKNIQVLFQQMSSIHIKIAICSRFGANLSLLILSNFFLEVVLSSIFVGTEELYAREVGFLE